MLATLPGGRGGFVAVSRVGRGEVVAVGLSGVFGWVGVETGVDTDNARFLAEPF